MSRFIESIRIEDEKVALLPMHQERMDNVYASLGKTNPHNLDDLFHALHHEGLGLYKWRLSYEVENRALSSQLTPYAVEVWEDFELMDGEGIDYHLKYEDRTALNRLKQKSNAAEVIIYQDKKITDTSFSNLIFKKEEEWFTPKSYLLNGVMRQHLLGTHQIKEADISLDNLKTYTHFQLINAMIPFGIQEYPIEKIINLYEVRSLEI